MIKENLTLLTDFYELTMMQGYFKNNTNETVIFDMFYRKNPSGSAFAITAGLQQVIEYINNLAFSKEDLDYLRGLNTFSEDFIKHLENFKFSGDIYAIPEGTVVFPHEPLIKIIAPIMEAQLIETAILNIINHQSLIATKAARICFATKGQPVMEFGLRRAQGPDAGVYGARASIIGGCVGTSNVLAGKLFDIPVLGTHAHSWIMSFEDELTAFRKYAELYTDNCTLLVDTYDTLKSGVPNAIKVFKELKDANKIPKKYGIRLDSGDLAYLSKESRKLLDEAGFTNATITASSDLDEYLINNLKTQDASITAWGVGTNMITSKDCPAFGGVYKLSAVQKNGAFVSKIKLSDNYEKITNPGNKTVYRVYDKETGKIKADLITLADETYTPDEPLMLFDPISTWKKSYLKENSYRLKELLVPVFKNGKCVYTSPTVMEIRKHALEDLETLWIESRRLINPHEVYVDLSKKLYNLKTSLLNDISSLNS